MGLVTDLPSKHMYSVLSMNLDSTIGSIVTVESIDVRL